MADNNPNPPVGGAPPKPPEGAKVQPKKETVRISLPPKPTATIKLPTLPPGGPGTASSAGVVAPPPATGAPVAPRAPVTAASSVAPPPPRPPTGTSGAAVSRPAAAPAPTNRPAPATHVTQARRVSGLDTGLAIAAALIGLAAVGSLFLLLQIK